MNKSAAHFIKTFIVQGLQQDKKSFSALPLDVSLFNQKNNIDLHIGLVTKLKLRKLMQEDIGNNEVHLFYDSVCFYVLRKMVPI